MGGLSVSASLTREQGELGNPKPAAPAAQRPALCSARPGVGGGPWGRGEGSDHRGAAIPTPGSESTARSTPTLKLCAVPSTEALQCPFRKNPSSDRPSREPHPGQNQSLCSVIEEKVHRTSSTLCGYRRPRSPGDQPRGPVTGGWSRGGGRGHREEADTQSPP